MTPPVHITSASADRIEYRRNRRGGAVKMVQEHYLRTDIPCNSALCASSECAAGLVDAPRLTSGASHYAIFDAAALAEYNELLELPALRGLIVLQTCLRHLAAADDRRPHRRIREVVADRRREAVCFSNEHAEATFASRNSDEPVEEHERRLVARAATWYASHLQQKMPIVVVSDTASWPAVGEGVEVVTPAEFVSRFYATATDVQDMHRSICAAIEARRETEKQGVHDAVSEFGYSEYRPRETLEAGVKSGLFVRGALHVNKYEAQTEAFVRVSDSLQQRGFAPGDILVHGSGDRNRAVHGDIVVIELYPESQWRTRTRRLKVSSGDEQQDQQSAEQSSGSPVPTGRVIGVLERNWRDYVATIQESQSETSSKVLGVPMDMRIPKIRFSTNNAAALKGMRIVLRLDRWPIDSHWPEGHFVRELGPAGDVDAETACILVEHEILVPPFSEAQIAELPTDTPENPWRPDPDEIERRRDIRDSHLVCSIDPLGCEDVDDALCARRLPNGNTELSVHIADVSYFVRPGMLTDQEARKRSTTYYLADRRYDMLPGILSANLCSLWDNVDRYAMSAFWEITPDGTVISEWFGRTVIRSMYKLHYEFAQALLDGQSEEQSIAALEALHGLPKSEAQKKLRDLTAAIRLLTETARRIKEKRVGCGALELESAEIRVKLDKDHKTVQELVPKTGLEIHETVAECMIFANSAVAGKISRVFPSHSLLRRHPMPSPDHFLELKEMAQRKGFEIDSRSNLTLARSLDACVNEDPEFNRIMRMLATKAMSEAEYFSTGAVDSAEWFHYGLGLEFYTHFTSPIRRYADVIVHRQLMAALAVEPNAEQMPSGQVSGTFSTNTAQLQSLCQHINGRNRASKISQQDSLQLFQALYFQDRESDPEACVADGVIVQLRGNGFLCYLPKFGFKSAVYLQDKAGVVTLPRGVVEAASAGNRTKGVALPLSQAIEPVMGGSLAATDGGIVATLASGKQIAFSLFEHVEVLVHVQASEYRLPSLALQLVRKRALGEVAPQREALVRNVQQVREREKLSREHDLDLAKEERLAAMQQESSNSLYALLQSFEALALVDGDSTEGAVDAAAPELPQSSE
eukprot:m.23790 g.23790  ORF g.23790 m.23790 type:complete len:1095 (-) comp4173_c0_seq1:8-3292(-)